VNPRTRGWQAVKLCESGSAWKRGRRAGYLPAQRSKSVAHVHSLVRTRPPQRGDSGFVLSGYLPQCSSPSVKRESCFCANRLSECGRFTSFARVRWVVCQTLRLSRHITSRDLNSADTAKLDVVYTCKHSVRRELV